MDVNVNEIAWIDDAQRKADIRPVAHLSSQIGAGPEYVAEVLGRLGAEQAEAGDAAPVVLGYN